MNQIGKGFDAVLAIPLYPIEGKGAAFVPAVRAEEYVQHFSPACAKKREELLLMVPSRSRKATFMAVPPV